MEQQREAGTLGMWVFLVTEIMFFGGMFLAYTLYRYNIRGVCRRQQSPGYKTRRHQHRGAHRQQFHHGDGVFQHADW
jgi:heme/copper-type cytochrome/quinol oxidase subunit 3